MTETAIEAAATGAISPAAAKRLVHTPGELAFLDVREHGQYGEGHPLLVVTCPYSRLELLAPVLVPRRNVPVLLFDDGDGVAERAAQRLSALGYGQVCWVAGGAPAWAAAGFSLFKGVNVPSKTLGELAEIVFHTPHVSVQQITAWREAGTPFRLFDGRPAAEHRKMSLPGAECLPNGELLHRLDAVVADETTPIVVSCAGRTRGIIGATGLSLAGVRNPVYALENGTQGWALAGFTLEHGRIAAALPELDAAEAEASRARGRALAERHDIPWIDAGRLAELMADRSRTLFVFDVRSAAEFSAGTLPGAVHAPGGQLAQATDQWIGVRRARVVLADDTGARASLTAYWLQRLGFEVFVLPDILRAAASGVTLQGHAQAPQARLPEATAADALSALESGARLIDLRPSQAFREAHLSGAAWAIRPRLSKLGLGGCEPVYLAGDADVAALAAIDLRDLGVEQIFRVTGDPADWRSAGLPVEASPDAPTQEEAIDFLWFVHDRHDGNLESARRYLTWEQGLMAQLDPDERAEFRL